MSDIEDIRTRHFQLDCTEDGPHCWFEGCDSKWPCDTAVVLAALDNCDEADRITRKACGEALRAARADADALAEALRECRERLAHHVIHDPLYPSGTVGDDRQVAEALAVEQAMEALAAHDANHPPENTANIPLKETR